MRFRISKLNGNEIIADLKSKRAFLRLLSRDPAVEGITEFAAFCAKKTH